MKKLKRKRYLENKKKKWFESKDSDKYIYIEGLPDDATEEELSKYFKKCGILKLDPHTGSESIKIYKDKETNQ